jgi:uncharacterized membrane protein SpoIIM required for sporulation
MIAKLVQVLRNEEGIETLEWIAIAVLVVIGIAFTVYNGPLVGAVSTAVANVASSIAP